MMKKLLGLLLALMLLTMSFSFAEELPTGEFVHLKDGDEIELWRENATVKFTPGKGYGEEPYSLQVGGSSAVSDFIYTCEAPQLLAVQFENGCLYFFIGGGSEDGYSEYHVYEYAGDNLHKIPYGLSYCDGRGNGELLRATKYGSFFVELYDVTAIGAFTHEQEYMISTGCGLNDISAVPAGMYPFGRIVKIIKDLPLLTSRESGAETVMLHEGDYAAIVASDGDSWAYLSKVCEEEIEDGYPEWCAGWVQMASGDNLSIMVNGQAEPAYIFIDGIIIGG